MYGPSLQDQGFDPEDCEEYRVPKYVKAHLRLYADFFDEYGEFPGDGGLEFSGGIKRFQLEEFVQFERDLHNLYARWFDDPYSKMWVLRYLLGVVE